MGISLTLHKTCNFDCIYCQLGRVKDKAFERKEYVKASEILSEFKSWLENNPAEAKKLSYITLSGAGEPTLNIKIDQIIKEIKKLTSVPVAVITNASLLNHQEVRLALKDADLIVPSLDAVSYEVFKNINQPVEGIKLEDIVNGLIALRKEFRGKIWLEVMLVKGVNDSLEEIRKLKEVIDRINPDKIQINSPVRIATKEDISCVGEDKLKKIRGILGDKAEIV